MNSQASKTENNAKLSIPMLSKLKYRLLILAFGVFVVVIGLSIQPGSEQTKERISSKLAITIEPKAQPKPEAPKHNWKDITVKDGDNLSAVFKRAGLNDASMYQVINHNNEAKKLTNLFPGEKLGFDIVDNELIALRHVKDLLDTVIFKKTEAGFETRHIVREPESRIDYRYTSLKDNLFLDGSKAGLSQNVIMDMANIFGGVIDFVYDPRKGDTFEVLYEQLYLDGEYYKDGNILAASYTNKGTQHTAYRYTDSNGKTGYFSEEGVSMRKAFLRAPVDFTRISSRFNPKRLHPIFKTSRPHRGIDYAARTGTPVFATGDGRVIAASYNNASGNYVVLQHGQAYTTKYLHLSKKHVKKGQRVTQGQIIGKVGSTGYATGPHLHYEFLVSGIHRNPSTILNKLPKAKSIEASQLTRFAQMVNPVKTQLAAYNATHTQLQASNGDSSQATGG
jgi:murein DD-endopeptidase MepM/ murein hydrolase activator NlpD